MDYVEKLKDPRWQKRRLEMLEKASWKCEICMDDKNTLHVHHLSYRDRQEPWEYDDGELVVLCHECHEIIHGKYLVSLFSALKALANRTQVSTIINMDDDKTRLKYLEVTALRLEQYR